MLLFGGAAVAAELAVDPLADVPGALRRWDDVEGRRHRPTLLEVADPELAARELPLDVRPFLHTRGFTIRADEIAF